MDNSEALRRLIISINKIDGIYYLCSRKLGIKYTTLTLLFAINDRKAHSQKKICDDWLIPKTTLNTIVKDMVKAGYLTLSPENNSHKKAIRLTEAGHIYSESLIKQFDVSEQLALENTLQKFSSEFVTALDYFAENLCDELRKQIIHKI